MRINTYSDKIKQLNDKLKSVGDVPESDLVILTFMVSTLLLIL